MVNIVKQVDHLVKSG